MYRFLKIISSVFCFLPRGLAVSAGGFLGKVFYWFSKKKKTVSLNNLKLVFPDKSPEELLPVVKESFKMFGMSVAELLRIPKEVKYFNRELVRVKGKDNLDKLIDDKGIIVAIHMGNWESANMLIASKSPYVVVVKKQKNKHLDRFLNEYRDLEGVESVFEDDLKKLVGYLKKGFILGIVFDHGSRDSRLYSEFFKKEIPVPMGALRIALHFKKKIYPAFVKREKGIYSCLEFLAPLEVKSKEDFPVVARALNRHFEGFLSKNPQGYLWWYKRFKRSKNLNLLVLIDGKPGHYKQSLSLAELIRQEKPGSIIEVVQINLSLAKRVFVDMCSIFSTRKCYGCLKCLKFILGRDFNRIYKYADIVISCGSSLSSLNRIFSYGTGAKSFVVQKPNINPGKHDLVILPNHDKIKDSPNVVKVKGCLSFLNHEKLRQDRDKVISISKGYRKDLTTLGIFIGGPLTKKCSRKDVIDKIEKIRDLSRERKYQVFLTTSRRTPGFVECFLKENLSDISLLIIANQKNYPFVSSGVQAVSDIVMVSSDSVAMITESAYLKPTLVMDIFNVKTSRKHSGFIEDLRENNYIKLADFGDLKRSLDQTLLAGDSLKRLDNRVVRTALKQKLK